MSVISVAVLDSDFNFLTTRCYRCCRSCDGLFRGPILFFAYFMRSLHQEMAFRCLSITMIASLSCSLMELLGYFLHIPSPTFRLHLILFCIPSKITVFVFFLENHCHRYVVIGNSKTKTCPTTALHYILIMGYPFYDSESRAKENT